MPQLITVNEARELVLDSVRPLEQERVPVEAALDRVLAGSVSARADVPAFAVSAMDGYAVRAGAAGRGLAVIGESRAGVPYGGSVGDGEAVRISTGAAVPAGATAVIRQEDVSATDGRIETAVAVPEGENVRGAGEDLRAGTAVLEGGAVLGVAELGAAVAAGAGQLLVTRRPGVAVLSTGDELRAPGEPLGAGEIHNSNGVMLTTLAARSGALTGAVTRLPDDREATERGLAGALDLADVVVVTGGVSVGPHDHVKPALAALGVEQRFWGVSLQPGKPTWFGTRADQLVFGLPGNPVSAVVTFTLFVAPALAALQGAPARATHSEATLGEAVRRNPSREQAVRVRLERRGDQTIAIPNGPQGSHIVTSLLGANALAMIPPGEGELAAGIRVALEPLPN